MNYIGFVHLRFQSELTVSSSTVRLKEALESAQKDSQVALAITDLDNLFGTAKFYNIARSAGVKPIIGCDVSLESRVDGLSNAIVLTKNYHGYQNLCSLLTAAYARSQVSERTLVKKEWITDSKPEGLIVLSGASKGDVGKAILRGNFEEAERIARGWSKWLSGDFYIELQRYDLLDSNRYNDGALKLASALNIPVVATHPTQFLRSTDYDLHEVRSCIFSNKTVADRTRERKFTGAQYFKCQQEMLELFQDIPIALSNTTELAKRCNFFIRYGSAKTPRLPMSLQDTTIKEYFIRTLVSGFQGRIMTKAVTVAEERYDYYKVRILQECRVIASMGFLGYFLVVTDFVSWAKNHKISVGPGRGSGAGSLAAFVLGITDINPIKYNLLFERFLNPDRVTMPDLDIDFCQERRDQVINYVRGKYGTSRVSQITAFGTLTTRAAIRDVGRTLSFNYPLVNSVVQLIPTRISYAITVVASLSAEPLLQRKYEEDNAVRQLINFAIRVEGLTRSVAIHAGGILIAPSRITNFCSMYTQPNDPNIMISQFDKDAIELVGLTKFDLLGLTTLTIISTTISHLRLLRNFTEYSLTNASMEDVAAFRLLQRSDTVAIFQLESQGMRDVLRIARPDSIKDVIALIALYRPGPIKLICSFFKRKHGLETPEYPNIALRPVLEETYGVMVYQEQVMQIAQAIGGYTLSEADLLRRVISKKQTDEMARHRSMFNSRAESLGMNFQQADAIFQLMEKFASYGFNKSHAAAYASLSFQTAWLKAHYPSEFLASSLSYSLTDLDRLKKLRNDCSKRGVRLLQPDINSSCYHFNPSSIVNTSVAVVISYGLGAIKGSGKSAIREILRARADRPFNSVLDFCLRTNRKNVNRKLVEVLIKSGSFDGLHTFLNRGSLLCLLPQITKYSQNIVIFKSNDIASFTEVNAEKVKELISKTTSPFSKKRVLHEENKVLGFYLTKHPFQYYESELTQLFTVSISLTKNTVASGARVTICGIITSVSLTVGNGKSVATIIIEDCTDHCLVFVKEDYQKYRLMKGGLVTVTGKTNIPETRERLTLVATNVLSLSQVRHLYCKSFGVKCREGNIAKKVRNILSHLNNQIGNIASVRVKISGIRSIVYQCCFHEILLKVATTIKSKIPSIKLAYGY